MFIVSLLCPGGTLELFNVPIVISVEEVKLFVVLIYKLELGEQCVEIINFNVIFAQVDGEKGPTLSNCLGQFGHMAFQTHI